MKMKVYLDTNIIYGYFKGRIEEEAKKTKFKLPFTLSFIKNNLNSIKPITSFFTMTEVADNLKQELNSSNKTIKESFRLFRKKYNIQILESFKLTGDVLNWFLNGIEIKDAIQLNIAKNQKALFVTEDKKLLLKAKKFYPQIITFHELKILTSSREIPLP